MAWLNAQPYGKSEPRFNLLESGDSRKELPEAPYQYLSDSLADMGLCRPDGLETRRDGKTDYLVRNMSPLSFQEIQAWCSFSGVKFTPWESETVRMLSEAYVLELNRARQADCQAPFDQRSMKDVRAQVSNQFRRLFIQSGGKPSD